jgi:hypothetical protein
MFYIDMAYYDGIIKKNWNFAANPSRVMTHLFFLYGMCAHIAFVEMMWLGAIATYVMSHPTYFMAH